MHTILNSVAILCGTVVVLCAWKVVNMLWVRPKKLEKYLREQGFKGNKYRLFFGDMKEASMMTNIAKSKQITLYSAGDDVLRRVLPFPRHLHKKYGKSFIIWFGWKPRLQIVEPDLIKEVVMNSSDFVKMRPNPLTKYLVTGVVAYNGDKWFKHRRLLNPAFHVEKLKNMLPDFQLSCRKIIQNWELMVMAKGSDSIELDVWSDIQNLTCDVIARTSFGSSYEEGVRIFELLKEQARLVGSTMKSIYIPGIRFLPTKNNRRIKAIHNEVQKLLRTAIDTRLKAIKAGKGKYDDLLGMMLESNIKNDDGNEMHRMTIDDIMQECKVFYFAGQETTSSLLAWTMILLGKHQDWQSRAREEVLNVFSKKGLDFDGLNHLKIVTMIIHEVLRLYPPAVGLFRRINKDIRVGEYTLPFGTEIGLPIMLLHYNDEIWGHDAKEFNPQRFFEGVSKATKNQLAYFPFGWGPRICIGQNFAMLEVKLALCMILKSFSIEVSPSYVHAPHVVITLQPQYGVPLILHKL